MKYICKTFGIFSVSVFDVINFSEIWRPTGLKYGFIKVLPNHNLKFRPKIAALVSTFCAPSRTENCRNKYFYLAKTHLFKNENYDNVLIFQNKRYRFVLLSLIRIVETST